MSPHFRGKGVDDLTNAGVSLHFWHITVPKIYIYTHYTYIIMQPFAERYCNIACMFMLFV